MLAFGFLHVLSLLSAASATQLKPRQSPLEERHAAALSEVPQLIAKTWPTEQQEKLARMVSKMMWTPINSSAVPLQQYNDDDPIQTFVHAGDFPYLWLRDSTASLHHLFGTGLIDKYPYLLDVVSGLARTIAAYVLLNPKCSVWKPPSGPKVSASDCWGNRTELDSPMYFLRLVRHLRERHAVVAAEATVISAVSAVIDHIEAEMGPEGLVHSDNRPSDDHSKSLNHYNVPDNFFVVAELRALAHAPTGTLTGPQQEKTAQLADRISAALAKHAVHDSLDVGGSVYCYEVKPADGDGDADCNLMDDANVPSLLALPYIAPGVFDADVYGRSRKWILSLSNPYFFENSDGSVKGLGSPHTPGRNVWPLGLLSQGLTSTDPAELVEVLHTVVNTDAKTDLMHESFRVDVGGGEWFSRSWFDWPNALFVELVHSCCSDLVTKFAPEAYALPDVAFKDWTTCGFEEGTCSLGPRALGVLRGAGPAEPSQLCLRYGSTFTGFVHEVVSAAELPVSCDKSLGSPNKPEGYAGYFPPPFHCAVAPASKCLTEEGSVVGISR